MHYVLQLCESGACVVYPSRQIIEFAIHRYGENSRLDVATRRIVWHGIIREAYAAVAHRQMKVEREIEMNLRVVDRNREMTTDSQRNATQARLIEELTAELDAAEIRLRILDDLRHTLGGMLFQQVTTSRQRRQQRHYAQRPAPEGV